MAQLTSETWNSGEHIKNIQDDVREPHIGRAMTLVLEPGFYVEGDILWKELHDLSIAFLYRTLACAKGYNQIGGYGYNLLKFKKTRDDMIDLLPALLALHDDPVRLITKPGNPHTSTLENTRAWLTGQRIEWERILRESGSALLRGTLSSDRKEDPGLKMNTYMNAKVDGEDTDPDTVIQGDKEYFPRSLAFVGYHQYLFWESVYGAGAATGN